MKQNNNMKLLLIIITAGHVDEVMEIARSAGAKGATIINARGEGAQHKTVMGITLDSEKEIILCIIDDATSENVMSAIKEHAGVKTPANSICLSLPVDNMVGIDMSIA